MGEIDVFQSCGHSVQQQSRPFNNDLVTSLIISLSDSVICEKEDDCEDLKRSSEDVTVEEKCCPSG